MRAVTDEVRRAYDQRLYRWLPEVDAVALGLAEALCVLREDGANDELVWAAESALTHLDYARKALEWKGLREIQLTDLEEVK